MSLPRDSYSCNPVGHLLVFVWVTIITLPLLAFGAAVALGAHLNGSSIGKLFVLEMYHDYKEFLMMGFK